LCVYAQDPENSSAQGAGYIDVIYDSEAQAQFEKKLGLSDTQKEKMQALAQERASAREKHEEKLSRLHAEMNNELAKENPDGSKLMGYATRNADLIEEATKQRIEHLLKVKQVLTKKQFELLLHYQWQEKQVRRRESKRQHRKK
jgi:Spy/CpxP family protein refolding chaperone